MIKKYKPKIYFEGGRYHCCIPYNMFGFDWKTHGLHGCGETPQAAYEDYLSWKKAADFVASVY